VDYVCEKIVKKNCVVFKEIERKCEIYSMANLCKVETVCIQQKLDGQHNNLKRNSASDI
jgi:hypothetical protein